MWEIAFCLPELAQGRSYWNRLRYLDLCEIAMDLFSKSYFCKYFLVLALELVNDPVANVRYGILKYKFTSSSPLVLKLHTVGPFHSLVMELALRLWDLFLWC